MTLQMATIFGTLVGFERLAAVLPTAILSTEGRTYEMQFALS